MLMTFGRLRLISAQPEDADDGIRYVTLGNETKRAVSCHLNAEAVGKAFWGVKVIRWPLRQECVELWRPP